MCQSVSLTEENRENPKKSPCFVAEHIVTLAILAREHQNFPPGLSRESSEGCSLRGRLLPSFDSAAAARRVRRCAAMAAPHTVDHLFSLKLGKKGHHPASCHVNLTKVE